MSRIDDVVNSHIRKLALNSRQKYKKRGAFICYFDNLADLITSTNFNMNFTTEDT